MLNRRQRPWLITLLVILGIWLLALGGYWLATQKKVTLEKLVARLHSTNLSGQNPSDRAKSLAELARMLNSLPYGERRTARMDEEWNRLFKQMSDAEKGDFLDATLPNGFKQMLTAFEQL
ncbi:MAG TPA: hypothetical protein VK968_07285, partial [Roseimicrobium sp.]|nr:hypothetical protein [Roseimicrobium sp.]